MTFRVAAAWPLVLAAILLIPFAAWAQQPETLTIYTDHPRLFLRPNRLRLLKRERERKSLRWDQFELLMAGKAPMPEQGFASALYYRVTESPDAAKRADCSVHRADALFTTANRLPPSWSKLRAVSSAD